MNLIVKNQQKNYFIFLYKYIYVNVFFYLIKKKEEQIFIVLFCILLFSMSIKNNIKY